MSEMESMFMQIFERKKRIIEQVKQRTLLFDQHLASKCLLQGIAPPPWLLSSSSPNDFNMEELISGLLVPRVPPGIPVLGSYNKPIVTASKGDLPAGFCSEVQPSNRGVEAAGYGLSVSLQSHVNEAGGASSRVQKQDSSAPATTPQHQRDTRISNVFPDPAQLLEKIQRSKSDLPDGVYAEVHSSNKAVDEARDLLPVSLQFPVIDAEGASSSAQKRNSSLLAASPQDQRNARISDVYPEPAQSLEKIKISKSDLPGSFSAEVHPINKAVIVARDRLSVSPRFPVTNIGGASSCVQKPDFSSAAASPQAQRDARISNISSKPAQSLENFQRFTSKLPDSLYAEVEPSNNAVDAAQDRLSVSPQLPVTDAVVVSSCVQKPDSGSAAASPQDQIDARISNVSLKPAQSLENFQRFTSEFPGNFYAEVEPSNNAVDAAQDRLSVSPQLPVIDAGVASSCVQKPDSSFAASLQSQKDSRMLEVSPWAAKSLAKIQRSKSRQRALELRHSAKSVKSHSHDENKTENKTSEGSKTENKSGVFGSGITGFEIAPVQNGNARGLELVESSDINYKNCGLDEAKVCDFHSKEKELSKEKLISGLLFPSPQPANSYSSDENVPNYKPAIISGNEELPAGLFSEVLASSNKSLSVAGQSVLHQFPVSDAGCASNVVLELDSSVTSPQYERKTRKSDIDAGPLQSLASVQRSKSNQRALQTCDSATVGKSFCAEKNVSVYSSEVTGPQIAVVQGDQVYKSEIVKTDDFDNESSKVDEAQLSSSQSMEQSSKIYSGRITRSRSSGQPQSFFIKEFFHIGRPTYIERSSRSKYDIGSAKSSQQQIEENAPLSGKIGDLLTNTMPTSISLRVDETAKSNVNRSPINDPVETCLTGGSKSSPVGISSVQLEHFNSLEFVKPVESHHERSVVEEPKIGGLQGKEKGSNAYSGRITRSRSSSQQAGSKRGLVSVNIDDHTASSSKSREQIGKKSVQSKESSKPGDEGSLPQSKRRKVNNRLNDSLSASPNLRVGGDVQSSVKYSPVVELNQDGGCQMLGGSHSSPKLQISERQLCLDEKNRSANRPLTFVQEELEVPFISSLADQTTGDPKRCSNIEAGGTDPSSVPNSSKQCTMGENKVLLQSELRLEKKKRSAHASFTFVLEELEAPFISSLADQAIRDSEGCSNVEAGLSVPFSVPDSSIQYTLEENKVLPSLDGKFQVGNMENLTCTERDKQERKSHLEENGDFIYCSGEFKTRKPMELIGADQAIPEFEGFTVETDYEQSCIGENISFEELNLPKSTIERASLLERLCKSASMHTPLSQFSTTYKFQRAPNLYQSVPNGLLECDLRSSFFEMGNIGKQLKASSFNEDVNSALEGKSYSDCLPFSSAQSTWDIRRPFTSPVGKLWDRTTSKSGSSEKRGSLNAELPCIIEENENTHEVADVFQEGISLEVISSPVKREPLADITEDPNLPACISKCEIFAARDSIESVKTNYSLSGTCNWVNQKLEHHNSSKKQLSNKMKVSNSTVPGENGIYRLRESVRNRFSKPKLSGKPSLRKGGSSIAEKETKPNNIVSNLNSFIPLVQRKQPAAIITGKRDVKVKALEAAEAAKRLAQEKENERKMKKEALKLERARVEQENLKQLEQQKKKKEEERKKKEAEIAARKRLREEEERKEKERKRKRVIDSLKHQRENEEKIRMKKENEVKGRAMNERANEVKVSKDETGKDNRKEKETGNENLEKLQKPGKASVAREVCKTSTGNGDNTKGMSNILKPLENQNFGTYQNQEESYDISPYKGSDDEDEEDDEIPNTKFIPSWASKNCVAEAIASQQTIDAETIFPRQSFCRIVEVLQPRKQQLYLR